MAEKKYAYLMKVGEDFEPLEFIVTPELNQQYLYAEEDFHPRYIEGSEGRPPMVHPGLFLNMSNNTRSPSFYLPPGWGEVHAGEDTEYLNPGRVGKKFRVTWMNHLFWFALAAGMRRQKKKNCSIFTPSGGLTLSASPGKLMPWPEGRA